MATNRGAYDPRQFLHYPDKDPFSDGAQERLDNLIKDFLHTGIAFANGASVQDVKPARGPSHHGLNGIVEDGEHASPEPATVEDEDRDYEDGLFRTDKGKGRDAREGPGLQGLWALKSRPEQSASPHGDSVDDAISLSSGSGTEAAALDDGDAEDGRGLFEDSYEEGEALEGTGQEYESGEDYGGGSDLEPTRSPKVSSEQDIIYIGDSDEEGDAPPNTEPAGGLDDTQQVHEDMRDRHSPEWASEYDEEEEREGHGMAWGYDEGSGASHGQGQEWHQSQGRESDEDEGDFLTDEMDREDLLPMSQTETIPAARRFFTSAPLVDPWVDAGSSGSASLLGPQSHWMQEHEGQNVEDHQEADGEGEDDALSAPFVSPGSGPGHEVEEQIDEEANELGPPPEQDDNHYSEALDPSLLPTDVDEGGTPYLFLPRPDPDVVAPGFITGPTGSLQDATFATEDQMPDSMGRESLSNAVGLSDLDGTTHTLVTAIPSLELPLNIENAELGMSEIVAPGGASHTLTETVLTADVAPSISSQITYPSLPRPSSSSVEDLGLFGVPPLEFTSTSVPGLPDINVIHDAMSGVDIGVPPQNDQRAEERQNGDSFVDDVISSGPPTEPILHDATFTPLSGDPIGQSKDIDGIREEMIINQDDTESYSSLPFVQTSEMYYPGSISQPSHERIRDRSSADIQDLPFTNEEGRDNKEHKSNPVTLHLAVFDEGDRARTEPQSLSPLLMADAGRMSIECHSIASDDFHNHAQTGDQGIITEVISEYGEDAQETGERGEDDYPEELTVPNVGDITFSDYVVYETMTDDGEARAGSPRADAQVTEAQADAFRHAIPSGSVPAISVGSSTPSLSPEATVTNASSAPDASVATSDLSTVNRASVSIVTATSSPPPIHVSRPSPAPADIRQPLMPHVGFASDDEEEENVLPDPRLPPEPTHLRIPVGLVGRGLGEDKEERAESVWVEPPTPHVRSEAGDGSSNGENGGVRTEKTPPSSTLHEPLPEEDTSDGNSGEPLVSNREIPENHPAAEQINAGSLVKHDQQTEHLGELAYPDSESDGPGKDGSLDRSAGTPGHDSHTSHSPLTSEAATKPSSHGLDPIPEDLPTTTVNGKPSRESSDNDEALSAETETITQTNGHHIDTNGLARASVETDGKGAEGSLDSFGRGNSSFTPSISGSDSPAKSERSVRRSTKSKGKAKAVAALDTRSESPPPQSIIRVQSKGSPMSRKRSYPSDATFSSSKQPRLTRSTTARVKSALSAGDRASTSVVSDDKSDVSSVASSSSMVSRILHRGGSGSSSIPSRSPSVVSQSSPTNTEHSSPTMPPPIRPYVPHNHSHNHTPAPPMSRDKALRHTPPVSHPSPSVSPSPSSLSQRTATQSTSAHLTRASCTDHKISLPGPEGLLYFLIPRCSLLDPEVEKDGSIVDCGVATKEEVKRAVGDLEAVGLDSNILGAIRQLAGVQLMREGQVGYLPKPGERIRARGKHRRPHVPPPSHTQDIAPEVDPSGPSGTDSSHLAPFDPDSATSPSSSSGSSFSEASKASGASDYKSPRARASIADREQHEPQEEVEEAEDDSDDGPETTVVPPPSSPTSTRSPKPNKARRRKLRTEDAAYQPEKDAGESSTDVDDAGVKKKKSKGGLKRKRSDGSTLGEDKSLSIVDTEQTDQKRKRKRKRKVMEISTNPDEPLHGASEPHRKKARRKAAPEPNSDTEDKLKPSV